MKLLDALRREHGIIESVAGALLAFASREDRDPADAVRFERFFRLYAGRFHHGREEQALFRALVDETGVSEDSGPMRSLLADHRALTTTVESIHSPQAARSYVSMLLHHIDAEDSVLFPECEARFRRVSLLELDAREPDDEERAAENDGLELAAKYGTAEIPGLLRGEGCVCCPAYGVSCDGVEREWSSEAEWEDMIERTGR